MLIFYGYAKCDTCRKARKWLDRHGLRHHFIDITEHPPTKKQLTHLITHAGYDLKALFNRAGMRYRQLKMKDRLPSLNQAQAIAELAGDGKLCKRPIVIDRETGRATVGFNPDTFAGVWKS